MGTLRNSPGGVFLQARIAFLQGERKGQENLKSDLVRRIKMLEYALKQERYDPTRPDPTPVDPTGETSLIGSLKSALFPS